MKKKWIKILATLFACATLALGFNACGDKENSSSDSSSGGDVSTEQSSSDSSSDSFDNNSGDNSSEQTHTHNYMAVTTAPTCTVQGFTTYTCACGDDYITDYVNALEHDFTNYISDNNATYEKDGTKTATCNRNGCEETDTVTDTGTKLQSGISFKTLSVDGTDVYGKVSYATETFSFINEVTAVGTAKYVVSLDIYGVQQVATKTIPLTVGDNKVYITETVDDEPVNVYTVTVRRRPMYDVTFNANGGSAVEKQVIEEDFCASQPTSTRTGYTFKAWNYDFATPITKNTEITASWTANENTPYKVEYYLQNLEDDNYTLKETVNKTGTTDTTANAEIKAFTHFTHIETATDSGNIAPNGSTVLRVYYTRDIYTVTFNGNGGTLTSGEQSQTVKYGGSVTAPSFEKVGYTFDGYDKTNYTNVSEDFTVTAQWVFYTVSTMTNDQNAGAFTEYTNKKITVGELVTVTTTTKDGYTCLGWYDGDNKVADGQDYSFIMETRNYNLTVKWKINQYTLTVVYGNGQADKAIIQDYNTAIITIENPEREYYEFIDWDKDIPTKMPAENMTVTAQWKSIFTVSGNAVIGLTAYGKYNYTELRIPSEIDGVEITSIGERAFYECSNLTSIEIPGGVTSIDDYAFYGCGSLTQIKIPENVTEIGVFDVFTNCSSLTSITVSEDNEYYKSIDGNLYTKDGTQLLQYAIGKEETIFVIPDNVTVIGRGAFAYCDSLTSMVIPDSVAHIGRGAFRGCHNLTEITLPFVFGSSTTKYEAVFGYIFGYTYSLSSAPISGATYQYCERFGGQYYYYHYYIPTNLRTVTITSGVISDYAFYNCEFLTSVTIGSNVETIKSWAFYNCNSLTNIEISDSVTSIEDYAFRECSSLRNVVVPNNVRHIGDGVFDGCAKLTSVKLPQYITSFGYWAFSNCNLTSVEIPDSVTIIGKYAFDNCSSLTSLVMPKSVKGIGSYAFRDCKSFKRIYYKGTATDWRETQMQINDGNDRFINAIRYYYVENEVDVPTDGGNYWHYDEYGNIAVW